MHLEGPIIYLVLFLLQMHNLFIFLLMLLLSRFSRVQLCNPTDGSLPGSSVPGILQARILEWVAISFSNAWKWKVKVKLHSWVRLFVTPWTVAHQAPLSMGFSRQEYWSGVPLPPPFLLMGKHYKCKLRDILQNNQLVFFVSIKVTKTRKSHKR